MFCNTKKLIEIMESKKYTRSKLAKDAKIDKSTLCRKMKKGEVFTIGEANRIVDTLKISEKDAIIIFLPTCRNNANINACDKGYNQKGEQP